MPNAGTPNQAWVIQKPSVGRYRPDVLALEDRPLGDPGPGELLVRTLRLSLDPSNLMWLKLQPGWMEEVKVGDIMKGQALAVVEESRSAGFAPGDIVAGMAPWRPRSVIAAEAVAPVRLAPGVPLDSHLSIFSHVGRAAMIGMTLVGRVRRGDVVLVSGAAGATGSVACQIAMAAGARVVGIAGGPEKCAWLTSELGIHAAIDYRAGDLDEALGRACPEGVDMLFENVGGAMLDTALKHMKVGGRVAICGIISEYSNAAPSDAYRYANLFQLLMKRIRIEGFVVPDFDDRLAEVDAALADLVAHGALKARTHMLEGLDQAAGGLELLLTGANHGKLMVRVSDLDPSD